MLETVKAARDHALEPAPTIGVHHGAVAAKYVGASGGAPFGARRKRKSLSVGLTSPSRCSRYQSKAKPVAILLWESLV